MVKPLLALLLLLPLALPGQDRLRGPALLVGNPGLCLDFIFDPGAQGLTHVEAVLGGRFSDILLPADAKRAPLLQVALQYQKDKEDSPSLPAYGGSLDLGEELKAQGSFFDPSLFGASGSLRYQVSIPQDLEPGSYLVFLEVQDKGLRLENRKTLHLTVPSMPEAKGLRLGDLHFMGRLQPGPDGSPQGQPNPWRQAGGSSGLPLIVAYRLDHDPALGIKRMVHRAAVTRVDTGKTLWQAEEERAVPPGGSSLNSFAMPPDELAKLEPGDYLWLTQAWPKDQPSDRVGAYKSFWVPSADDEAQQPDAAADSSGDTPAAKSRHGRKQE
jgi:hypothetical protein